MSNNYDIKWDNLVSKKCWNDLSNDEKALVWEYAFYGIDEFVAVMGGGIVYGDYIKKAKIGDK